MFRSCSCGYSADRECWLSGEHDGNIAAAYERRKALRAHARCVKQANKLVKLAIKKSTETKDQHKYVCSATLTLFANTTTDSSPPPPKTAKTFTFFYVRLVFSAIRFSFLLAFSPRCLSRFHSADAFFVSFVRWCAALVL